MFPDKDRTLIEELMIECRDPDDVIQRLKNDDESANWKKNQTKSKKINPERPSRNGPKRQPRETKTPPPTKNNKEPTGALLQKKKQPDFGPASNATWGDIKEVNGEIISTAEPVQPKQQPTKPQEKSAPVQQEASAPANQQQTNQQASGQHHQNNKRNQTTHNINPENIQQPQTQPENQNQQQQNQTPSKNENANVKSQKPKNASLFLPVSLNNITPDLSKFGVFAGPLPQEAPPKRAPQLACVSIQPTYVVPLRQKVLISNQLHHFEIKRPPSPPPQPKIQPPALATHETQTTAPISAQKEEQPSEIQQQQLQQQVPVSQASSMPHVAPNAPIGPIGSQPVVFNYPYAPFAFPYPQYDPAGTPQAQQPLAFIQYPPYNPQGYPIPYPIPGYTPMQPAMPQGAQQTQPPQAQAQAPAQNQQQQQQQQNQRQIPKNYSNNKPQYSEEQRQGYNYSNTQNSRASYQPPMHQNRTNANFQ